MTRTPYLPLEGRGIARSPALEGEVDARSESGGGLLLV